MAAGKWKLYENAKELIARGQIDLDSDIFKINLYLSTSNANDLTLANAFLADLTFQVATAFGYTQSTKAVTLALSEAAGVVTVDETTNPVWTASGGAITARFAVIYDDTHASKAALCVCLLDTTPADVSATDGNTLTITQAVSGLFTLSGAASD
jgi:hypothetical protein